MALPAKDAKITDWGFDLKITNQIERKPQLTVIYSAGGGGKTTVSSYAKKPIILPVYLETGADVVACPKFPPCGADQNPVHHVFAAIRWLMEAKHTRETLVIDHASALRAAVQADVLQDLGKTEKGNAPPAYTVAGQSYPYYGALLAYIYRLQRKRGMDVILLAHSEKYTDWVDDKGIDQISLSAISGEKTNVRLLFEGQADNVYCIKNNPVVAGREEKGVTVKKTNIIVGQGKTVIYTRPKQQYFAKNRLAFHMANEYEILPCEDEMALKYAKTEQSIINFWRDFYNNPEYLPEPTKLK